MAIAVEKQCCKQQYNFLIHSDKDALTDLPTMMNPLEEDEPLDLFQGIASLKTRILSRTVLQIDKEPATVTVEKEKKKKSWQRLVMFMCRSSETRSECKVPCFIEASVHSG